MILEEALEQVTEALAPKSLNPIQLDVFRKAWDEQPYHKLARELNHEYSYIKDVGAEMWQLLTQAFGLQVTKLNLHEALTRYVQQKQGCNSFESAAGIFEGGQTGFTAIVVAILFLISLLFTPLFAAIPAFATTSVLVMVGVLMMSCVRFID